MYSALSIQAVKSAATQDIKTLAAEAGFIPAGGRRCRCCAHRDKNPSAVRYPDGVHCFVCGKTFDVIDLARIIIDDSTAAAIAWLAARYGINAEQSQRVERFSEETYTHAELFRVGFRWRIERGLELLKHWDALDETPIAENTPEREQILALTTLFARLERMNRFRLMQFYTRCRSLWPKFVNSVVSDARETRLTFAQIFAAAGSAEKKVAA